MEYDFNYDEDEIVPRSSKTRFTKITLYLEVPADYSEDDLEHKFDNMLKDSVIQTTSFSDIIMGPIGSDNPEDFEEPVGFIAPDGKFYLMEGKENGLAHLELTPRVIERYKDIIDDRLLRSSGVSDDYGLERAGFVKVHMYDIRYLAHFRAIWGYGEDVYTPDLTDAQINSIIRYGKLYNWEGDVIVNEKRTALSTIRNADKLALRKIFELR